MKLAAIALLIFLVSLPFGYWRAGVSRFSWAWFAAVHIPVPLVFGLRLELFGWDYMAIAAFLAAYAAGQFTGGRARNLLAVRAKDSLTWSLMHDLHRHWRRQRSVGQG